MPRQGPWYKSVVVSRKSANLKGIGTLRVVQDAELVVGKDNVTLKDRYEPEGRKLKDWEVEAIVESAESAAIL